MSSWAIVGAARGIGYEFVTQLSSDPANTVFALIRSQKTADKLKNLAASRSNIHVLETNTSSSKALKDTAEQLGEVTQGKLDALIYNAYSMGSAEGSFLSPSGFTDKDTELEQEMIDTLKANCIQVMYTVNAFLPLIRLGQGKKIVYITSGIGDIELTRVCEIPNLLGYGVSKAAGNLLMAKYSVDLKGEGISTLALSPGWVATDAAVQLTANQELYNWMLNSFRKMDPSLKEMITPEESVKAQLNVIRGLSAANSGEFVSHRGDNKSWF